MSIGLKNNNPGHIRLSPISYMGEVVPSGNVAFKQFKSIDWGYRAIFVVLHTYKIRYGLDTLEGMIQRYAPPTENDTRRYIEFVSYRSGLAKDEKLDTLSAETMKPIVTAISRMENGIEADPREIDKGWELFVEHKA